MAEESRAGFDLPALPKYTYWELRNHFKDNLIAKPQRYESEANAEHSAEIYPCVYSDSAVLRYIFHLLLESPKLRFQRQPDGYFGARKYKFAVGFDDHRY